MELKRVVLDGASWPIFGMWLLGLMLSGCEKQSAPLAPPQLSETEWKVILVHEFSTAGAHLTDHVMNVRSFVESNPRSKILPFLVDLATEGQDESEAAYAALNSVGEWDHARQVLMAVSDPCELSGGGLPPILDAIYEDDMDVLRHLLERGCDPNQFRNDMSFLASAVAADNAGAAELLFEFGADPDAKKTGHLSPRELARQKGMAVFD